MTRLIIESNGTVDNYIGDAIMAFWGAPHELADHAVQACLAAPAELSSALMCALRAHQ